MPIWNNTKHIYGNTANEWTNLQITTYCLSQGWIESCVQKNTVIQEESKYAGTKQNNLHPKTHKNTACQNIKIKRNLDLKLEPDCYNPFSSCFSMNRRYVHLNWWKQNTLFTQLKWTKMLQQIATKYHQIVNRIAMWNTW